MSWQRLCGKGANVNAKQEREASPPNPSQLASFLSITQPPRGKAWPPFNPNTNRFFPLLYHPTTTGQAGPHGQRGGGAAGPLPLRRHHARLHGAGGRRQAEHRGIYTYTLT